MSKRPVLTIRMGSTKPTVVIGKDTKIKTQYPAEYLTFFKRSLPTGQKGKV